MISGHFIFRRSIYFTLLTFSFFHCQSNNNLEELTNLMTGSFSSQEQAEQDSNYYDIRLQMVPIWTDKENGNWLYVEQAASWSLDKPYRQRVYQLVGGEGGIINSIIYSIPQPLRFAGVWRESEPLKNLSQDSLQIREGCIVLLKKTSPSEYTGTTNNNDCRSNLRGATYATTKVFITEDKIISWDRGIDQIGSQVWGATKGGYIFKRIR
jgi:CpeT protein